MGARYDPSADTWTPVSSGPGAPGARQWQTAVWTGTEMIVWGGAFGSAGARYDPVGDIWTATAQDWTTPTGRSWPSAVWDGSRMLVWGGENSTTVLGDGEGYCSCTGDPSAVYYLDRDRDGRGDPATGTVHACGQPPGWSKLPTDCDDDDNTIFGGALQRCDGINNDCDDPCWPAMPAGEADDDLDGQRICGGDCDDAAPSIYAGAPQLCHGINNDCEDPGWPALEETNEVDDDGDTLSECAGDCDDTRASVYPGAPQLCDGLNNDCNDPGWPAVAADEADSDHDGWRICAGDCDDVHAVVYPGAPQICDGINDDCNDPSWPVGAPGEVDADLDGWKICAGDCDDAEPAIYPWALQLCDGLNNDCSDPSWPTAPADEIDDDCDDGNDQVWAVPGYVNDLAMSVTPQQYIQMSWSQPADPGAVSVTYDVIRSGDNGNYTSAATCVETGDGSDTTALDVTPLPGQAYFFLVRVRNGCPGGTAVAPDSSGQPRAVRTCP